MSEDELRAAVWTECGEVWEDGRDFGLLSAVAERQGWDDQAAVNRAVASIMHAVQQFCRGVGGQEESNESV